LTLHSGYRNINRLSIDYACRPGCGKTTLLKALAGKLSISGLKVTGEVEYNGVELSGFVPEKTAAYIDQYDLHVPEMTVRETIDFSARFQGVGNRAGN
jgi:ABC-type multidrug transport system ATPase subunit